MKGGYVLRKKIYVFFIIIIMCLTLSSKNVKAYDQMVADYNMIFNQPLEKLQKQLQEISNEYVSYNNNMFATINVTVTKKQDKDGSTYYLIGEGENAIIWETLPEYIFADEEKSSWDVWLDVQYTIYDNPAENDLRYNAYVQNVYLNNTNDFDPEKDGWKGTKVIDGWVKKGGEVIGDVVGGIGNAVGGVGNAVGGVFKFATKTIPGFIGGLKDLKSNLQKNFVGTLLTGLLDILKFVADLFQMLADSFQTMNLGTVGDMTITYSVDYLNKDGAGKIDDKGSGNRDMYTKVATFTTKSSDKPETPEGEKESKDEETNVINIDGEKEGFTKDTPIPVIPGDLYYISLGNIELLDINFLTVNEENHPNEKSPWMYLRNFATAVIHITLYIAAAFLVIMLIIQGIRIVTKTYNNPEERAEHIEGLSRFAVSLLMLIGTVVIMALAIFGSKSIFNDIKKDSSNEGPIRVNVKEAGYSFSTTVTGYFRYMAEIEDVDRYVEKAVYTFAYIALVIVNFIVMIFMFFRMIIMLVLAMAGPIIAVLQALNIQNGMSYKKWVELYIRLALVQVIIGVIYRIILKYIIS